MGAVRSAGAGSSAGRMLPAVKGTIGIAEKEQAISHLYLSEAPPATDKTGQFIIITNGFWGCLAICSMQYPRH